MLLFIALKPRRFLRTVRTGKILERDLKKKKKKKKGTLSAIQTRDHANREIPSASRCVLCNTGVRTLYTHRDTSHKQTQVRTHRSRESNICTRPALEPQQRAAVLTAATCCYCGLCGKAGLLPAATEWTQYPDSWSHGPRASGPPPACLLRCQLSFQSFISLHPPLPHSMQISVMQQRCRTVSLTLGHEGCVCGRKIKIGPTSLRYFLYRRSIDTSHKSFSAAVQDNKWAAILFI